MGLIFAKLVRTIYQSIPWYGLIDHFKLKENRKDSTRIFSPHGMNVLMILKSYVDCSDRKLIEQMNGNINLQMFCDIFLQGKRLTNFKIVSQVRTYLSGRLDILEAQKVLANYWKPLMDRPNIMLTDATCYESSVHYPTNVKLLWESVDLCHGHQTEVGPIFIETRYPASTVQFLFLILPKS